MVAPEQVGLAALLRPSHPALTLGAKDGTLGWAERLPHRLGPGDKHFLPDPHFSPFHGRFPPQLR